MHLTRGTLVDRTPERSLLQPSMRWLHRLKRLVEWHSLRACR
jgi:hypothetical protein